MNEALILLLLLTTAHATNPTQDDECKIKFLSSQTFAPGLNHTVNETIRTIYEKTSKMDYNLSSISRDIFLDNPYLQGIVLSVRNEEILALNVSNRLKVFPNYTQETDAFWKSFKISNNGWNVPFKDCFFLKRTWFYAYHFKSNNLSVSLFIEIVLNRCDKELQEIFNGPHQCPEESTYCVGEKNATETKAGYHCLCRPGYYYPGIGVPGKGFSGEDIENGRIDTRCIKCPPGCNVCESSGVCTDNSHVITKTVVVSIQTVFCIATVIVGVIVFKQRKTKAIASGMWTILETILLGIFILYIMVIVRSFDASVVQCLLEPWAREVGFIICYGAIILKLYRHLIEFRTRKAHRWVVKDTDLLKYLLIMIMSVLAYMAAYTSITLNFMQENFSLLHVGTTLDGGRYRVCKPLWWDYVTEAGELVILIFGIHLSYASRNARTQFHERNFLCAAISIELAVSTIFYVAKVLLLPSLHPDIVLIIYCIRSQLSTTLTLLLVFIPKFWYQQKQVRSLGQEYSCRIPIEGFKDVNAHGPLTGNNSDVDVGEVTLADMSPDDIRAELKRLYLQLEIFKSKTICRDNPHISKRRGGRKAQHRRFSLQKKGSREKNLHGKNKERERQKQMEETTEAEPSRTPEDSVCSNEGPSAVYADLPSTTNTSTDHK